MQRSNSAPELEAEASNPYPCDVSFTVGAPTPTTTTTATTTTTTPAVATIQDILDANAEAPKSKRKSRKKQISVSTIATGMSTEHPDDDDDDLRPMKEEKEDDEEDANMEHLHHGGEGSCGRGIISDFKRTVGTYWWQEMTNFNQQTVAVSFFIFLAAIAPAITFGAIYAKATHNWIGAVEMITATAWCGIVYALIGGQPMMINGGTGPVLAFTEIIFKMSKSVDVPFLTFNCWIGIWVSIYMCLAAFVDLNRIIVYATRFTDEIFSLLIALIFIINALGNPFAPVGLYYYFDPHHPSHDMHEGEPGYSSMASALLSVLISIGTVQLAFVFRKAKFSPFLPNQTCRNAVTDFAVVASIAIWTLIDQVLFKDIPTETLNVPDSFAPTYECCTQACESNWPEDCPYQEEPFGRRAWFVDIGDLNGQQWVPFMAAGPALLAFILVFLDDGITWHLINHPSHKLTHGAAYNYDTLIIGVMILVNSLLGLPWLVAATVRSLNHVHALAEKTPDGKIESVHETRLTHLGIHLLCFISIFALNALKVIPMPVLYGVFLFMGLVSLGTNQFWGRLQMFFMQPSKYPIEPFTQFMKPNRIRLYTGIQLGLFVLMYTVKAIKTIAIAFPIIIALCIPVRLYVLPRIFTPEELVMIDSDDATVKKYLEAKAAAQDELAKEEDLASDDADIENQRIGTEDGKQGDNLQTGNGTAEGLDHDLVLGLPSQTDLSPEKRKEKRQKRKKSVPCPAGLLFEEALATAAAATPDTATDDDTSSACSSIDDAHIVPLGERMQMRRRRRKKSLSCPTHTLFQEAERHVNNNYFFG